MTALPTTKRPQARSQETRQRLIETALVEFAEKGYGGATMRSIAGRAGVALASLPYHFKTKDSLWRASADHIFGLFAERFASRRDGLRGVGALTRASLLLREFVLFSAEHPELHRFLLQEGAERTERMEWLVERHIQHNVRRVDELVEDLKAEGYRVSGDSKFLFYRLVGAAATVFAASSQVELVTGEDPFSKDNIEEHAEFVVQLFFPGTRAGQ